VKIAVRADRTLGGVQPFWQSSATTRANYSYAPEGRKLLNEIAALGPRPAHIRTPSPVDQRRRHALAEVEQQRAYREDADGRPSYDWTILDRIFDTFRDAGEKPFVEIGFMPQALSIRPSRTRTRS